MKKLLLFVAAMIASASLHAQDVITFRNGDEQQVKVLEISDSEIRYKTWSNQEGPTRTKSISDVVRIKYANGETEVFNSTESSSVVAIDERDALYKVGDIYQENGLVGIVVYVDATGCHGLILHPKRVKCNDGWCKPRFDDIMVGADNREDGMANMVAVKRYIEANGLKSSDSPIYEACIALGEGWYIPAMKEVEYIIMAANDGKLSEWDKYSLDAFEDKLKSIGGDKLKPKYNRIISSTEGDKYMECYNFKQITAGWGVFTNTAFIKIIKDRYRKASVALYYRAVHKF